MDDEVAKAALLVRLVPQLDHVERLHLAVLQPVANRVTYIEEAEVAAQVDVRRDLIANAVGEYPIRLRAE